MVVIYKFKKYLKMGMSKINNHLRTDLFVSTGKFLPPPLRIYYTISNRCNYQCRMCSHWKRGMNETGENYLREEEMKLVINDMAELKIGELGISGGEPLIYKDKMLALLGYANRKGIYTHFVTNGSLLTKEILDRYEALGGGHVSLSIDAISEKHDELRGTKGAYERFIKAFRLFQDGGYKKIVLKLNTVLSQGNLDEILAVVQFAIKNKSLIFIQPFDVYDFQKRYSLKQREEFYSLWIKQENALKLRSVLDQIIKLKRIHPDLVLNEEKHLKGMYDYFIKGITGTVCYAGIDQLILDPEGKITFCKFGQIGDLKKESLKDFLKSERRLKIIKNSLKCKQGCMLGCMYRPSFKDLVLNGPRQFLRLIKK